MPKILSDSKTSWSSTSTDRVTATCDNVNDTEFDDYNNDDASRNITRILENTKFETFDIYVKALPNTFGLVDHYYMVHDGVSYHMGKNRMINIRKVPESHTLIRKLYKCEQCTSDFYKNLHANEDVRLFNFYPFVNCESLSVGFSAQSLCLLSIPLAFTTFIVFGALLVSIIILLVGLIFCLWIGKYDRSRIKHKFCQHLCSLIENGIS
ncbi:Ac81 [Phenacoccus solenopsis nudivirus]|nr:Ac81 [Phenacoccus solenopsis nudivirus]